MVASMVMYAYTMNLKCFLKSYKKYIREKFHQGALTIIFFGDFCRHGIKT